MNCKSFPLLGRLARDYLCCVGSSCAVERTFSSAADVCTSARGGLASRTIERAVAVCQWLKQNLIPDGAIGDAVQTVERLIDALGLKRNKNKNA